MAKRRCFSIDFLESTPFRKLSKDAKLLYFSLLAHSDDEGVVINPEISLLMTNTDEATIDELFEHNFLLKIRDLYIIKHWNLHNKIQASKKTKSLYTEELSKLTVNEKKEYVFL